MSEHHILVIDDDERLRTLLRRFLEESGFRVTVAGNASEARQILAGIEFDLLVVDIMMPGEDRPGILDRHPRRQRGAGIVSDRYVGC